MSYAVPRELQIQLLYMQITGDMRMASGSTLKPLGCSNSKLRQLTRRVSQHYDHRMGEIGLKATQYSLLSNVFQHGPIRPGNLAKAMALDSRSVQAPTTAVTSSPSRAQDVRSSPWRSAVGRSHRRASTICWGSSGCSRCTS
jgi:hypothetical protein